MARSRARQAGRVDDPMTASEKAELRAITEELELEGILAKRPKTFAECMATNERCGWVSCRHHLGVTVDGPLVKITRPVVDSDPSRAHLLAKLPKDAVTVKRMFEEENMSVGEISSETGIPIRRVRTLRANERRVLSSDPELDIMNMTETCSLKAARTPMSAVEVADMMGLSPWEIYAAEESALASLASALKRMGLRKLGSDEDETPDDERDGDEYW